MAKMGIPGISIVNTRYGDKSMIITVKITNRWKFTGHCWRVLNHDYVIPWYLKPEMFCRLVWAVYRDS